MSTKPWGGSGIGSWAAEAERAEAEERELASSTPPVTTTTATTANPQSFPSLKDAVKEKSKKKKMSLSEFNTYSSSSSTSGSFSSTRLTPDEMLQLPTGPKPRAPDEYSSGPRLGGGFSSYGGGGGSLRRGGFDDDNRRGPSRRGGSDFEAHQQMPSRADEVDNWASAKRAIPPPGMDSGRGSSRYGSLGGGGSGSGGGYGSSRADEVDNWNFGKKPTAPGPAPGPGRSGGFGSGFRDSGGDWRRERDGFGVGGGVGGGNEMGGRPRLVLDPPRGGGGMGNGNEVVVKVNKPNPFGGAKPREEVLAEKGLDWKKLDLEIEAKKASSSGSRPTSSQGSRPTSSHSNRSESVVGGVGGGEVKPRPKLNPFGDAKPREVLLEEKGLDWKKIDFELEHRRVDRAETEEEKALKDEIENLKKEVGKEADNDVSQESEGEQTSVRDLIQIKEKELETLVRELDDKVRFGQKAADRPGSGAGRFTSFPERPPSQSGSFDGARGPELMDRPRSRGTGDVWTRPGEDRRGGFQGGRDNRGFLSNRDFDRSRSRERW